MSQSPSLHMLQTCPFCWKVRGMTDYLKIDVNQVQVNAMKTKKELAFAGDWGKVPVWTSSSGEVVVDSTPILKYIDKEHFDGKISARGDEEKTNNGWNGLIQNYPKQLSQFCMERLVLLSKLPLGLQDWKNLVSYLEGCTHGLAFYYVGNHSKKENQK